MQARHLAAAIVGLALFGDAAAASADVTTYTSRAAFDLAVMDLDPLAQVDFESLADATTISSGSLIGDIKFTYSLTGGAQLMVVGGFATTSGSNSLGTVGDLVLLAGDGFTLDFPAATAIGLQVIGEDLLPGDVVLQTVAGDVELGEAEETLPDESEAFFLGLVESDPLLAFASADVVSFYVEEVGDFVWNVDDIQTAPEPGASLLAAVAIATGAGLARRRYA